MVILFILSNIVLLMGIVVAVYAITHYPATKKLKRKIARLRKRGDSLLEEMIMIEENGVEAANEARVKKMEEEMQLTVERMKKYIEIQKERNKLIWISIYMGIAALLCEIFYYFVLR